MSKVHEVAAAVAEIILSETETHQLLMPEVETELAQQLTADDENAPIFSGCTGEHRAKIRALRETILEFTLAGIGAKATARKLGISPQTVRAVRASAWQRGELDPLKQRLGRDYLAIADLMRAEAMERVDEIPAHVLLLASAQAADKGQLLTGAPTARIEHSKPVPSDLNDIIDALPVLVPVVTEGDADQKGDSPRLALDAPSVRRVALTDSQSACSTGECAACLPVGLPAEVKP